MCLAVPMRIEQINGQLGIVNIGGVSRDIGLTLIDSPKIGDYVLVHAGFAIQKIDEEQAMETIELLKAIAGDPSPL